MIANIDYTISLPKELYSIRLEVIPLVMAKKSLLDYLIIWFILGALMINCNSSRKNEKID